MTWLLSLLTVLAVLAMLRLGLHLVEDLESQNRIVEAQLNAAQLYDKALEERAKEMRRFRHDVNGLLQAIEFSRFEAAEADNATDKPESPTKGALPLVDAVLQLKRRQCAQASMPFICEIDDGSLAAVRYIGIDEDDLCAIVQNLLENAFEESLGVQPTSEHIIEFHMKALSSTRLRISVRNRTASSQEPTFQTTKQDADHHGIGLQTVRTLVREHGGSLTHDFDSDQRLLTMCVTIG